MQGTWKRDNRLNCAEAARGWRTRLSTDFDPQAGLMPCVTCRVSGWGRGCRELGKRRQDPTGPASSMTRSLRGFATHLPPFRENSLRRFVMIYQSHQVFYLGFSFLDCKNFLVYDRNVSICFKDLTNFDFSPALSNSDHECSGDLGDHLSNPPFCR